MHPIGSVSPTDQGEEPSLSFTLGSFSPTLGVLTTDPDKMLTLGTATTLGARLNTNFARDECLENKGEANACMNYSFQLIIPSYTK